MNSAIFLFCIRAFDNNLFECTLLSSAENAFTSDRETAFEIPCVIFCSLENKEHPESRKHAQCKCVYLIAMITIFSERGTK